MRILEYQPQTCLQFVRHINKEIRVLHSKIHPYSTLSNAYRWLKINLLHSISPLTFLAVCSLSSPAQAYPNNCTNSEYNQVNSTIMVQPKIHWYRYLGSNGQPSLSSTITEQHLQYGYEALDRNMQIICKVPPYSADHYAKQKAQRDILMAQRAADLELRRNYGSASQAANKRDTILADMITRKSYLQAQLVGLQSSLNSKITQAASFDRQRKPIPATLQKDLNENRKNVEEAQRNIQSIELRQKQIKDEYDQIILRINKLDR